MRMKRVKQIVTPKSFYVQERDRLYADWSISFWRELFQNSVDAGARRIDVSVSMEPGKGSFGRGAAVPEVVRIVFSDDGCGMSKEVLENVYFRPGETTKKDGNSTGGYGRARLMTCFSQVRYAIRTRDNAVEGDGPDYHCESVGQTRADLLDERAELVRERDEELAPRAASLPPAQGWVEVPADDPAVAERAAVLARLDEVGRGIALCDAALAELDAGPAFLDGCRVEIDVNPAEYPDRTWKNVGMARLLERLDEYLGQSQLPCKVFVNGQERAEQCRRGPARRVLTAALEDGREVEFAKVHLSQSENAKHKGMVIVRVDGAAMFVERISTNHQVILEIDKAMSRDVLTSNRDGFQERFKASFQGLLEDLTADVRSALEDKEKRKHVHIDGRLGTMKVARQKPAVREMDLSGGGSAAAFNDAPARRAGTPRPRYTTPDEFERHGLGGVPRDAFEELFRKVSDYEDTFLDDFLGDVSGFKRTARWHGMDEALRSAPDDLLDFMVRVLSRRLADAEARAAEAADGRLRDMHDVHMQIEDVNPKIRKAIHRHDPRNWDAATGRGMQPRMLLTSWTVCCEHAIRALQRISPKLGDVEFGTGWLFDQAKSQWVGDEYRKVGTGAIHKKVDDLHLLLLNPVDDDGRMAYTPSRREDQQALVALAIHEVCHLLSPRHDEYFAWLQTEMTRAFDFRAAHKAMDQANAAVRKTFAEGKARVQGMDRGDGVRPWERLAAHAAPGAAAVYGFPSGGRAGPFGTESDGVREVDCDALGALERDLRGGAPRGRAEDSGPDGDAGPDEEPGYRAMRA